MIVNVKRRQIPKVLSHHTSFECAKNILSVLSGNDEICFRAVSNKMKNDSEEIKMGGYMHQKICEYLNAEGIKSMLQQFSGYEDSASVSFSEGESSVYMIENYGDIRLDFDLRGDSTNKIYECEYVDKDSLVDYTYDYILKFKKNQDNIVAAKSCSSNAVALGFAINRAMMEEDVMTKPFCIKEKRWEKEKEWRIIISLKDTDVDLLYDDKKRAYKNVNISKSALKSVVVFCRIGNILNGIRNCLAIRKILREKEYSAKLKLRIYRRYSASLSLDHFIAGLR